MKLNIAICDDEQNQIQYIKDIASAWAETSRHFPHFAEFPSAEAFLFDYAENQNYDILLLDIEMAKMNGIDLAKKYAREIIVCRSFSLRDIPILCQRDLKWRHFII